MAFYLGDSRPETKRRFTGPVQFQFDPIPIQSCTPISAGDTVVFFFSSSTTTRISSPHSVFFFFCKHEDQEMILEKGCNRLLIKDSAIWVEVEGIASQYGRALQKILKSCRESCKLNLSQPLLLEVQYVREWTGLENG